MNSSRLDEVAIDQAELVQYLEAQAQPEVPKSFHRGYRQDAIETARKTKQAAALGTETILRMAGWIQEMKSCLNRKEFGAFVRDLLEWVGDEARKYLDIARVFEGFDLSRLQSLEPFTIFKLRSKRYSEIVAKLREQAIITPKLVQALIKELLPKPDRKRKTTSVRGDSVLQRHPNVSDGTFYFTLKEVNLSDKAGTWLEQKLETLTVGQVLDQAAQSEEQLRELAHSESEKELQALQAQKEQLEIQVKQQQAKIAELEAKLAQAQTVSEQETEVSELNDDSSQPREQLMERLTTWKEVAAFVKRDCNKLLKLARNGGHSSKEQVLVELLSAHLKKESPDVLEQLAWVPKKLLDKALLSLSQEKLNLCN